MNLYKRLIVFLFFNVQLTNIYSQEIVVICGEYSYHVPETESMKVAKHTASERARLEALAATFGTTVSQDNTTIIDNKNGESHTQFYSIGESSVKGEWLGDTEQPEYEFMIDTKTGNQIILAKVCGKARKILSVRTKLEAKLLRNGIEDKFESDFFNDGDDFYASFLAPSDGYLMIYWMNEDIQAIPLLPYEKDRRKNFPIKANERQVFFAKTSMNDNNKIVDEYTLACEGDEELNALYFIFSQKEFEKPILKDGYVDFKTFNQWLHKIQQVDLSSQVVKKTFLIKNK